MIYLPDLERKFEGPEAPSVYFPFPFVTVKLYHQVIHHFVEALLKGLLPFGGKQGIAWQENTCFHNMIIVAGILFLLQQDFALNDTIVKFGYGFKPVPDLLLQIGA